MLYLSSSHSLSFNSLWRLDRKEGGKIQLNIMVSLVKRKQISVHFIFHFDDFLKLEFSLPLCRPLLFLQEGGIDRIWLRLGGVCACVKWRKKLEWILPYAWSLWKQGIPSQTQRWMVSVLQFKPALWQSVCEEDTVLHFNAYLAL